MKSFQQPHVSPYRGKCKAIVRSIREPGEIKVSATAIELEGGEAVVNILN